MDSSLHLYYGGTFDPVHNGHLAIARSARDELGCTVRLMPAADPPHRAPPGADAGQRVHMLELAVAGEPGLVVDPRELQREGRSYSIDTLRQLRAELGPEAPVALLIGADSYLGLPTWHQWRDLFGLAHFVVAPRPGSAVEGQPGEAGPDPELAAVSAGRWSASAAELERLPAGRLFLLDPPLRPESASEVRGRIAAGRPWQSLVPPAVAAYIVSHGLYAGLAPGRSPL